MANTDSTTCVRCGNKLSDDGIEINGETFDRACVTFAEVKAEADRVREADFRRRQLHAEANGLAFPGQW
jgi:hypothetical protein